MLMHAASGQRASRSSKVTTGWWPQASLDRSGAHTPMTLIELHGSTLNRSEVWPAEEHHGLPVLLEDVPAFVELESGGPPPVACRVVGVGQPPSHPTKEGDRREQHLPEEGPLCPA